MGYRLLEDAVKQARTTWSIFKRASTVYHGSDGYHVVSGGRNLPINKEAAKREKWRVVGEITRSNGKWTGEPIHLSREPNPKGRKMPKRKASAKQIAWRKKFAAMAKSGNFHKKKHYADNPKRKSRKVHFGGLPVVRYRYMVEANTPQGWKEIYNAGSKSEAARDAKKWRHDTGQETRIVPGPTHKTRRSNPRNKWKTLPGFVYVDTSGGGFSYGMDAVTEVPFVFTHRDPVKKRYSWKISQADPSKLRALLSSHPSGRVIMSMNQLKAALRP